MRTADLSDQYAGHLQVCRLALRSFGGRAAFEGEIATVRCPDDHGLVRQAVHEAGRGRVLVVDGGGPAAHALLGDMLGGAAVANGWAGVVLHAAVRDVPALATLDLGVLALGTCPRRGTGEGRGERDVPVSFGSVTFHPGFRLYADEDGVLVSGGDKEGGD